MKEKQYKIGEIADKLQISATTIRYYEQENLLPQIHKSESGIRVFSEADMEWLKVIQCLKRTGMSIQAIKEFVAYAAMGDSTLMERFTILDKQRKILQEQIASLQSNLKYLDYKCSYYQKALELGSTDNLPPTPIDEILQN